MSSATLKIYANADGPSAMATVVCPQGTLSMGSAIQSGDAGFGGATLYLFGRSLQQQLDIFYRVLVHTSGIRSYSEDQ